MISNATGDGKALRFNGSVLLVAASQRKAVEDVLKSCGCEGKGDWSTAVSGVEPYDSSVGSDVSIWSLSFDRNINVADIQSALDFIE